MAPRSLTADGRHISCSPPTASGSPCPPRGQEAAYHIMVPAAGALLPPLRPPGANSYLNSASRSSLPKWRKEAQLLIKGHGEKFLSQAS